MVKKKVIIVGGGAAGFFCAANLDESYFHVQILEQNSEVLQKVKISGGGRCNVTHACYDPRELVNFYPRGARELISVFTKFQPGDMMAWLSDRNVPVKIEADNRVFPESNTSSSIIGCFTEAVVLKQYEILTKTTVLAISSAGSGYLIRTNRGDYSADIVIYTPGSAPKSLKILESLGHNTVPAVPSLFTFNIEDPMLKDLAGTSFSDAEITISGLKTSESGPMLITHWGLSGPAVLKLSAWKARELAALGYRFSIEVNFIATGYEEAEKIFTQFKKENPKKSLGQSRIFAVTSRFWNQLLAVSKVDASKQVGNIPERDMRIILSNLCRRNMQVSGKSTNKDEFVTAGGVELKEVNFKNMSSRILPNFYIAGEVLNIDAITGGFNFQACWSEAWLIAQYLNYEGQNS